MNCILRISDKNDNPNSDMIIFIHTGSDIEFHFIIAPSNLILKHKHHFSSEKSTR